MTPPEGTPLGERLVRMEGKLDAYAAGQSARLDAVDKRLDRHDEALDDLRAAASSPAPARLSPWQAAGVIIAAVALLAPGLNALITLIDRIAK